MSLQDHHRAGMASDRGGPTDTPQPELRSLLAPRRRTTPTRRHAKPEGAHWPRQGNATPAARLDQCTRHEGAPRS